MLVHTVQWRKRCCIADSRFLLQLSTQRVITMEWVEGCRVDDKKALRQLSIRPRDAAVLLLDAFAEMTYVHGFVHADPHPGNVLVRPAPHQGALSFLPPLLLLLFIFVFCSCCFCFSSSVSCMLNRLEGLARYPRCP